jgi:sulfur carrier protein
MKLIINGEPVETPDGLTIRGLLEHLDLTSGPVAVERNLEVVPRADHEATQLAEGDALEIVHFVGGG